MGEVMIREACLRKWVLNLKDEKKADTRRPAQKTNSGEEINKGKCHRVPDVLQGKVKASVIIV